jgi:hypothetical protein
VTTACAAVDGARQAPTLPGRRYCASRYGLQLNRAGAGDSLAEVVAGYAAVAEAAGALADALEAAGE